MGIMIGDRSRSPLGQPFLRLPGGRASIPGSSVQGKPGHLVSSPPVPGRAAASGVAIASVVDQQLLSSQALLPCAKSEKVRVRQCAMRRIANLSKVLDHASLMVVRSRRDRQHLTPFLPFPGALVSW